MVSLSEAQKRFQALFSELGKVVVGQEDVIEQFLVAILSNSHAIVEGYPGLAKTLLVKSLAETMDLSFSRIQGTPDLLPSDITGTYIIDESKGRREFKFQPGPVFANIILVDEINRAPPKVHSALLESMQERQVTVGNSTYKLEEPFFVLATMNPIEQEGVFLLPEAQSDRFLFKIKISYPEYKDELEIINRFTEGRAVTELKKVFDKDMILGLHRIVRDVPIANDIKKYALDIVASTREKKNLIEYGASPRAAIGLVLAAKARALLRGRKYVSKEDIQTMAYPVLRHRIILNFEAERQNLSEDDVIKQLLKQ
ncbi:MAG TPA: MoxR family ATPase [Candidatus Nanoarchaeia archaeon]|nr:MoxR family ATPase [Candidatus Nanoarchaeia archaeon]